MSNLIERLEALTIADGKEIGSYREGTGLRGENAELTAIIERLEGALREIAASELSSGGQLRMLAREALDKERT